MLTARQQERRLVADALVGIGSAPRRSPSRWSRPPTSSAPARRSTGSCGPTNPLRAEESVLRTAVLPGSAARGRRQPGAGARRRRALRDGPRVPHPARPVRAGDGPLPDEPEHVALALGRARPPTPGRGRPPVDVYDARRRRAGGARRARHPRRRARADVAHRLPRRPRRAACVVDGRDAGTVGEVAPEVLAALGLDAPVVAAELVLDTLLDAAAAATAASVRRRGSRLRPSTSRSCSPTPSPPPTSCATLRERGR